MELFNEAESILDALPQDEGELEETLTYQRKKPGRKPLSKHIPRAVVRYELPAAERVCACGHALHEAGEDKSEQLDQRGHLNRNLRFRRRTCSKLS